MAENQEVESPVSKIERWLMRTQGKITLALFFCFIFLMIASVGYPSEATQQATNTFLPIISGWIGVVLGFFFSREISGYFENKLNSVREEAEEDLVEYNEEIAKFMENQENQIERLKADLKHTIEEDKQTINRLRKFVDYYRRKSHTNNSGESSKRSSDK